MSPTWSNVPHTWTWPDLTLAVVQPDTTCTVQAMQTVGDKLFTTLHNYNWITTPVILYFFVLSVNICMNTVKFSMPIKYANAQIDSLCLAEQSVNIWKWERFQNYKTKTELFGRLLWGGGGGGWLQCQVPLEQLHNGRAIRWLSYKREEAC